MLHKLFFTVLYCTILYSTILYYTILYSARLWLSQCRLTQRAGSGDMSAAYAQAVWESGCRSLKLQHLGLGFRV